METHTSRNQSNLINQNSYLITGSDDRHLKILNTKSNQLIKDKHKTSDLRIRRMVITPDEEYLFTTDCELLKQYSLRNFELVKSYSDVITGQHGIINALCTSKCGKYLFVGCQWPFIYSIDITEKKLIRWYYEKDDCISLALTPNNKYLYCGSYQAIFRYQLDENSGELVKMNKMRSDEITKQIWSLSITPDGKYLFSGSSVWCLIQWDAETSQKIRKIQQNQDHDRYDRIFFR